MLNDADDMNNSDVHGHRQWY